MRQAALRPFAAAFVALATLADAARTFASARLTTCLVAFWNWSTAAVEAANVDLNALTAASEPAGAFLVAFSTQAAASFVYVDQASSANAVNCAWASDEIS